MWYVYVLIPHDDYFRYESHTCTTNKKKAKKGIIIEKQPICCEINETGLIREIS